MVALPGGSLPVPAAVGISTRSPLRSVAHVRACECHTLLTFSQMGRVRGPLGTSLGGALCQGTFRKVALSVSECVCICSKTEVDAHKSISVSHVRSSTAVQGTRVPCRVGEEAGTHGLPSGPSFPSPQRNPS